MARTRGRKLFLDAVVDRHRRRRAEALLDLEHGRERLAQPKPGWRQREQAHVVGEHLPHVAVVHLAPAEPGLLERHALRVEHPHDVMVGRDEEPPGRLEPRGRIGEQSNVDVPVRADDRELGDAAVELETDVRGAVDVAVDVAVGP